MPSKIQISSYHKSLAKFLLDKSMSLFGFVLILPIFVLTSLIIFASSGSPIFFKQIRVGKNGKPFQMIKFRTMKKGSEKLQKSLSKLNEADGPVFKILNDPRFTKFGKALARTGLDETPQLINVLKNEMSIVGPRPLPLSEAKNLTLEQKAREMVLPGITSSWIINGSHRLSFGKWMKLDNEYLTNASLLYDISILIKTSIIVVRQTVRQALNLLLKQF